MVSRRIALMVLLAAAAPLGAQTMCEQIKALTNDPTVSGAHWGVAVASLDGTLLCGVDEGKLFRPASNNKIFTTATALAFLGPDYTFTTRVVAEGQVSDGVLRGDLKLIGGGDANFGSHDVPYVAPADRPKNPVAEPPTIADIESLADQVAAKGIRRITGNIVGDDSYFAWQPYPPDWSIDDMVYGYGAPVSALTIHDNEIDLRVSPGVRSGAGASVSWIPDIPYYAVDMQINTSEFGGTCGEQLSVARAPGSKTLTVYGNIRPGAAPCNQAVAIQDPAEYAAMALKLALQRRGVQIAGGVTVHHYEAHLPGSVFGDYRNYESMMLTVTAQPPEAHARVVANCVSQQATVAVGDPPRLPQTELATHTSPTLLADILFTNKVSQNMHAETLLRNLGAAFTCERTQRDGLNVIRGYILHAGVLPSDFVLYDGSGLSDHDLVAPRALVMFLGFAATQPWFPQFKASLPSGGSDGTLGARFKGMQAGTLSAKTGTLGESRALSGYVTTAGGKTLVFSVMVDNHLPGRTADRVVMDKIVGVIAGGN